MKKSFRNIATVVLVLAMVVAFAASCASPTAAPTYTPYPTYTSVPMPTQASAPVGQPTYTPYPTYTPVPTYTPAPTPTASGPLAPIVLGMPACFSFGNVAPALQIRDTWKMVIDEANRQGGIDGHPIQFISMDDAMDPAKTTTDTVKLITVDNAMAIVGSVTSTEALAIKDAVTKDKTPYIGGCPAETTIDTPATPWVFRTNFQNAQMAAQLVDLVHSLGKNVAISYSSSAYGTGGRDDIEKALKDKYGMAPVDTEAVAPGTTDLTTSLMAMKAKGTDVICCWDLTPDLVVLFKSLSAMGWDVPVTTITSDMPMATSVIGQVNVHQFSLGWTNPSNPNVQKVIDLWASTYGTTIGVHDGYVFPNYDAAQIIVDALRRAKLSFNPAQLAQDRAKLRDAIESTSNFPASCGPAGSTYSFSLSNHEGCKPSFYVTWESRNGADWSVYTPGR